MSERARLLRKASQCYLNEGLVQDACRCLEAMDDYIKAGKLYEQEGEWLNAARAFEKAAVWSEAARCYQQVEAYENAARCFVQAGDTLQAAWFYAGFVHQFKHARRILQEYPVDTLGEQLLVNSILARCESGEGNIAKASQYLDEIIRRFGEVEAMAERGRLETWSLAAAESLHRPDLCAALFAAAYRAGVPMAEQRWEAWALRALGDANGIPHGAYQASPMEMD